jgi:hypothetical protein
LFSAPQRFVLLNGFPVEGESLTDSIIPLCQRLATDGGEKLSLLGGV